MTAIDAVSAWFTFPLDAVRGADGVRGALGFVLAGFGFGLVHALLPGHGKALLGFRHALPVAGGATGPAATRYVLPLLDGIAISGARALTALLLVVAAAAIARTLGVTVSPERLRMSVGLALLVFAGFVAFHALRHGPAALGPTRKLAAPLGGSLVAIAFVPEPVALGVASLGLFGGDLQAAAFVLMGLALGMGTTLGLFAALAANGARSRAGAQLAARAAPYAAALLALVLALAGAVVLSGA